jgi:putative endonuclease
MPWHVYILLCDQKTFYVGMTHNLEQRLREHQRKESFFTKKFSDIRLVYSESHPSKMLAQERELQLKKWSAAKKKALISGNKELLRALCKGPEVGDAPAGRK